MAEPEVHTELTMFLDGLPLPLANPDQHQAALDASIGDPTRNSTQRAANPGAAYTSSFHLLPQKGCASQDPSACFINPTAHVSCFAHSHSVSAYTKILQADCAGLSCPVPLSKGTHARLITPGNEGRMDRQQFSLECSTVACMASHEEGVLFLHKGQGDPVELLTMASVNSCEESTSLYEEGGDSTARQGSHEDFTALHAGCDDSCDDTDDIAHACRIRGGSVNGYDGVQDPLEEVPDPSLQQADADATTSSLQPCSSECSSVISMVSNGTPEITSRLDSNCANVDAMESHWTDSKHGSYLDYMETSFVKNLYRREYCALDVCGQQPPHQASQNLSPWPATLFEFKSWQSGDWHRRSMLKPPLLTCIPLALRPSPWVNHFRHRKLPRAKQIKIEDVCTFSGIDGEEEVDSPANEVYRGVLGHDHTSGSNFEFGHDPDIPSRGNTKKRRLESNLEQEQAGQVFKEYMCR